MQGSYLNIALSIFESEVFYWLIPAMGMQRWHRSTIDMSYLEWSRLEILNTM